MKRIVKLNREIKNAIMLAVMCSLSYFAVYVARNTLSAVSPQMIEKGFSEKQIGSLASVYFIVYAIGQLVNGLIGNKVKAKYMISFGLGLAGICSILFSKTTEISIFSYIIYGFMGFCLAMIYAPMSKTVAENTKPIYATRCSLGYTTASLLGSPAAGIFAAFLSWHVAFCNAGAMLIILGIVCFVVFTVFEKRGIIKYKKRTIVNKNTSGIKALLRMYIIKFSLIAIITGVIRTSVVFWLPAYLSQYLGLSTKNSSLAFTFATFIISLSSFVSVFIYEKFRRNITKTMFFDFAVSAILFLCLYIIKNPIINIIVLILAIMASNCADSLLWCVYCPRLKRTGLISGAIGFLDFLSYIAASISSSVFANAVSAIGWNNLILVWFGIIAVGLMVSLPIKYRHLNKKLILQKDDKFD